MRAVALRPLAAPRPAVRSANRTPSSKRFITIGSQAMKAQRAVPEKPLPFDQLDAWMNQREDMLVKYRAGQATMEQVAALADFFRHNAFTPSLMQHATKIRNAKKAGKADEAAKLLQQYEVLAQEAVVKREKSAQEAIAKVEAEEKKRQQGSAGAKV